MFSCLVNSLYCRKKTVSLTAISAKHLWTKSNCSRVGSGLPLIVFSICESASKISSTVASFCLKRLMALISLSSKLISDEVFSDPTNLSRVAIVAGFFENRCLTTACSDLNRDNKKTIAPSNPFNHGVRLAMYPGEPHHTQEHRPSQLKQKQSGAFRILAGSGAMRHD